MSKGNQNGVARTEFQAIKQQLKTANITEVAAKTKRSASTISKIKRATSYAKFIELNKGYQAAQTKHRNEAKTATTTKAEQSAAPVKKSTAKAIIPVVKSSKTKVAVKTAKQNDFKVDDVPLRATKKVVSPGDDKKTYKDAPIDAKLIDTLNRPSRRTKAHAKEVLDLRTQLATITKERDQLKAANGLLNQANDEAEARLAEYEALEVIKKAREGRSFVSRLAALRRKERV